MKNAPWKASLAFVNNEPNRYVITDGGWGSETIAQAWQEDDARRIVKSVNMHEELLEALAIALPYIEDALYSDDFKSGTVKLDIEKVRALIEKADAKNLEL